MYKTEKKIMSALFGAAFLCGSLFAAEPASDFTISLSNLARDIHAAQRAVSESGGTSASAALSRESASYENLKKLLTKVETAEQIAAVSQEVRLYGYRVSNTAEKRAFYEALRLLEVRVKYLSQTEDPTLADSLVSVQSIASEFENSFIRLDRKPQSAVNGTARALAASARVPSALLGANVKDGRTVFSVYSPDATEVKLYTYKTATSKTGTAYTMKKNTDGVWTAALDGELYGTYYSFTAAGPKKAGFLFDPERHLSDPYAFANVDHNGRSVVVDRNFKWTDSKFKRPDSKDAIIYEMHVKDFTAHKSSGVSAALSGKYLGMLEGAGSDKVIGHLKDLGVNVIELMPVHEYDNNFAGTCNHWGYMTSHFFAPECSYASGKKGEAVKELKTLINGLHGHGFAVILDVVFNHTAEGNHEGLPLNFKGFDNPGYYRLMEDKNYYWNGTGCGNEMRTENPMTAKMILDSLKYWMKEYHVDGFRFDLGTIIDKKTMQRIIDELPASTILTSEPWAADWQRNQWAKSDFRNTRLSKWNDDYREKIRSFVSGNGSRNDVMTVMAGSCFWWSAKPAESLNYLEAHDGYTLYDLFNCNKKQTALAAVCLLTAQGVPMIHSGQEFNRSKGGNHNSYDQDNATNYINWDVKEKNKDIFELYRGLIKLRKTYPNFRHAVALNGQHIDWLQPANNNGLGMYLKGTENFLVLLNGDQQNWISFKMPIDGSWKIICNGEKIDLKGLGTAEGDYNVPPCTGVILQKH